MSPRPAVTTRRAVWLLFAVASRRWLNRVRSQWFRGLRRRTSGPQDRQPTPSKYRRGTVGAVVIGALFVVMAANMSAEYVAKLSNAFTTAANATRVAPGVYAILEWARDDIARDQDAARRGEVAAAEATARRGDTMTVVRRELEAAASSADEVESLISTFERRGLDAFYPPDARPWAVTGAATRGSSDYRTAIAVTLCLSFLSLVFVSLGGANQDLGRVEWSFEWLFTLPVPSRALFVAKILEYTVLNPLSWIVHGSFLLTVSWAAGFGGWSVPIALGATLYVNTLLALVRVLAETWLRKALPRHHRKNLQAFATVLGMALMLLLYLVVLREPSGAFEWVVHRAPASVAWTPWSLPALAIAADPTPAYAAATALTLIVGSTAVAVRVAEHLVCDGLIAAPGGYQGSRGAVDATNPSSGYFRGIVGRELRLMLRDRNLLVQSVVVPAMIVGGQFALNPSLFDGATSDPRHAAALAFGCGALVLMGSAVMVLASEGRALWLVYTFPQRIERVLSRKAALWAAISTTYAVAILAIAGALGSVANAQFWLGGAMAVTGLLIFSIIASGLGMLGTNPLERTEQRKVRPAILHLYMLLAGIYGYGMYAPLWTKLNLVVLSSLLALSIWQVVRDRAPFLLDPTQQPPPRIALSDGLIAVLGFTVVQSIVVAAAGGTAAGPLRFIAFTVAGATVSATVLYAFWRRKVPHILRTVGLRRDQRPRASSGAGAVVLGVACGACAAAFALAYLWALDAVEPLRVLRDRAIDDTAVAAPDAHLWLAVIAIAAAPPLEELIFRGLVFRALRRSASAGLAIAGSAALFAIVHPPLSALPVFVLGIATAWSFERTGLLLAPICAHAVYNGIVVGTSMS